MRRRSNVTIFPLFGRDGDEESLSSSGSSLCRQGDSSSSISSTSSSEYGEHLALFHKLDCLRRSPIAGLYKRIVNHEGGDADGDRGVGGGLNNGDETCNLPKLIQAINLDGYYSCDFFSFLI